MIPVNVNTPAYGVKFVTYLDELATDINEAKQLVEKAAKTAKNGGFIQYYVDYAISYKKLSKPIDPEELDLFWVNGSGKVHSLMLYYDAYIGLVGIYANPHEAPESVMSLLECDIDAEENRKGYIEKIYSAFFSL